MKALTSPEKSLYKDKRAASSHSSISCNHCGGNGYMKTSPSCYHTCLVCLGRGLLISDS